MTIRNWFRWQFWYEIKQWWYCWRHKVVRVADNVRVLSFSTDSLIDSECILSPISGNMFTENSVAQNLGLSIGCNERITLTIENTSKRIIPFTASIFIITRSNTEIVTIERKEIQPNSQRTFNVIPRNFGYIQKLYIPTYLPKGVKLH
jgi:hypothetical protein